MTPVVRNIAIWGSTGSIGRSALEVVAALPDRLKVVALSAHSNLPLALKQAQALRPRWLVATDEAAARAFDWSALPKETELITGPAGVVELSARPEIEVVLAAIVGSAGLHGTWAAVAAGKTVALANKETMVVAGSLVTRLAAKSGAKILPVDSEHSAVFQALAAGQPREVRRIILTASGGPFRQHTKEQLAHVTLADALAHPTWDMGTKITIDSATMLNKALEIIEARWLFDLPAEQIDVVVHPQSVVHSMVEFADGSLVAQLSPPDMRLPIQFALTWPERCAGPADRLDFGQLQHWTFEPPDHDRFPALPLGREVARSGGTAGVVLNAAKEAAVNEFIQGKITFLEIVPACRAVLEQHDFDPNPSLERLLELDRWARQEMHTWIGC